MVATFLTGCVNFGAVRQSWEAAEVEIVTDAVHVSGKMSDAQTLADLAQLPKHSKFPTIVYFHGCTGRAGGVIRAGTRDFWRDLLQDGYAIVAPNSFARDNRTPLCGKGTVQLFTRLPEIDYAVRRLKSLSWVDTANIVLVGFSEGGGALSQYRGDDARAIVILGNDCDLGIRFRGPSLAILSVNDKWIKKSNPCTQASRRLALEGSRHNVLVVPQAQMLFRRFLQDPLVR